MPTVKKPKQKAAKVKREPKIARPERQIVYPVVEVSICEGAEALTVAKAKDLIGWEELPTRDDTCVPELKSILQKNIRLTNNTRNRYLTSSWLLTLRQEHLHRQWRLNGETIVIGQTGEVLSGQHRLLSFILAYYEWLDGKGRMFWQDIWPDEPTMETMVVYGIKEDDDTFKTLNTGKPGTLSEVLYRSEYLANYKAGKRKTLARMLEHAVKMLWLRTGAKDDPFTPKRTHGEELDFIQRHPHVIRAAKHIYEENQPEYTTATDASGKEVRTKVEGATISDWLSPGYASAVLYLMACSDSDIDDYGGLAHPVAERTEKKLSWKYWDAACEFFVLLKGANGTLQELKYALGAIRDPKTGSGGTPAEKLALFAKAWIAYRDKGKITKKDVHLEYAVDEDTGEKTLAEYPTFGGIDVEQAEPPVEDDGVNEDGTTRLDPGEADRVSERRKRAEELAARLKAQREAKAKPAEEPIIEGATAELPPVPEVNGQTQPPTLTEEVQRLAAANPGKVLLVYLNGVYNVYGDDAKNVARVLKTKANKYPDGMTRTSFGDGEEGDAAIIKLQAAGLQLALVTRSTDGTTYQAVPVSPGPQQDAKPTPKKVKAGK